MNLSLHPKNAELMVQNKGLNLLMDRLVGPEDLSGESSASKDPLLLKIIRNISQWTFQQQLQISSEEYKYRGLWTAHVKTLAKISLESASNHDVLVEVFGILANLSASDLPSNLTWAKLLSISITENKKDFTLLDLIIRMLSSSSVHHDMMLETLLVLGSITQDTQVV